MEFLKSLNLQLIKREIKFNKQLLLIYKKLYMDDKYSFFYESLENNKNGRYSILGGKPFLIFKSKGKNIEISLDEDEKINFKDNPLKILRSIINHFSYLPYVPPFSGGALGYVAYDTIRFIEDIPDNNPDELNLPEIYFIFPSEIMIFDHKKKIANIVFLSNNKKVEKRFKIIKNGIKNLYDKAERNLKLENRISQTINFDKKRFIQNVKKAKEYIASGEIFQVVLSERAKVEISAKPFDIYKSLRKTNPSPYMYFLKFGDLNILGSSPEILVKAENKKAIIRPLAGTRRRGVNNEEDKKLEKELLNDEKELAEHIMLVDLARNDLGRVCEYGSVKVNNMFGIEKYSKVMHIVSNVEGKLKKDKGIIELFNASFPAGTVSGSPKIRAMEIIDELETKKRAIYAGSIGYFGFSGNMDMCITIRTIVIKANICFIQAGAGIVADSVPENEYNEIIDKSKALFSAVERAHRVY